MNPVWFGKERMISSPNLIRMRSCTDAAMWQMPQNDCIVIFQTGKLLTAAGAYQSIQASAELPSL